MTTSTGAVTTGGIDVHYESHGEGGVPLVLLHGGLANTELQFGALIPRLAERRRVIGVDLEGHGRTPDRGDLPLTVGRLAQDVCAVLDHLEIPVADVLGFSLGGATAIQLALDHPDRVRRLVVSSVAFRPDGNRGRENVEAVGRMSVDMIAGSPLEASYLAQSPHPDREHLQHLLDRLGDFMANAPAWSEDQIRGIAAPTLITVGDADMVRLEHAVEFLRLRGGDVNADFVGLPASQLAVLPGTSHFNGTANTQLVLDVVTPFLDAA
jgi:pimeloyl-ACP methyl ester carboxylesterase